MINKAINSEKHQFRYYSREVLKRPTELMLHEQRLRLARKFPQNEPLQGALADLFYGCWYDMPLQGEAILATVADRLPLPTRNHFRDCIEKNSYVQRISEVATRWSVLVTPSLNVASHSLRVSSDDARQIAADFGARLIKAKANNDKQQLTQIEDDFLGHCLACVDRIGFSLVWFRLARNGWVFDERWVACQRQLEQMPAREASV